MDWQSKTVLVTGGCSFIGSHLVDALVERNVSMIRVVDDLSSGNIDNIGTHIRSGRVEFKEGNLLNSSVVELALTDVDIVFHLAANHGGRGYIDLHQAECATNLALDGLVIREAHRVGVEQFVFASSGCVYPTNIQGDPNETVYLMEELVKPPYQADDMYGWAKLMTELSLKAYHQDYGFRCVSLRYFTAYGERCLINHAVMAMIARAFIGQDPFVVWGTGEQIRNWTYVSDIVDGTIRAAERVEDGTAINLGTMARTSVLDAAKHVLEHCGVEAQIITDLKKPTGPYNRVSDNRLAKQLLSWEPKVSFEEGVARTIAWFYDTYDRDELIANFEQKLTYR